MVEYILNWSRLSEQKFRVDKWSLLPGLGRRAERRKIEVGLIRGAVVKARMWATAIVQRGLRTPTGPFFARFFIGIIPGLVAEFAFMGQSTKLVMSSSAAR